MGMVVIPTLHSGVKAKENQDIVPTLYWLDKNYIKTSIK